MERCVGGNAAAASSVASDIVIQQTAYGYDGDGNQVETVTAQRFSTDPQSGTGSTGSLFTDAANADGSLTVTATGGTNSSLAARIYYSGTYYDNADRVIASVNAGTNPTGTGGAATPWARPAAAPASVTDSNFTGDLITLTSYNPAGWQSVTTDARGVMALNLYNNLGETVATIANYSGTPVPAGDTGPALDNWLSTQATSANQITEFNYDGLGDQTSMTAINVDANTLATSTQTTTYLYGVSPTTGSTLTSNDLLYQTVYPSNGQNDAVSNAYNALGQTITVTDRNGSTHEITYDNLGRQISDVVTTLGAGVDGSILRIDTAYNSQGLPYLLTSYADTAGTQIVNQVENIYNGLGQITQQYQAVNGAVDTSTTPVVQYTYSDPSIGSIPMSVIYPNGRSIYFGYEAGIDNSIGRLSLIMDGANSGDTNQVLEQYSYLGLSTIVGISRPQTGIDMSLLGTAGSIGSGGDQYTGLDQFGRIASQQWANSAGTVLDGYTYTYDQNNNVTSKNNVLNSAYSETYTNDNLNRLTAVTRGGAAYQSWNLDSQGNWSSNTTSGTTQTRTTNDQNQIASISGTAGTPQYDANGNMTTDQNGNTLKYDAWNRLVSVTNSAGQIIAEYTYNPISQRVTETYPVAAPGIPANTVKNLYYSASGQVLEERWNGTAASDTQYQYVWSATYVNAMVLRDTFVAGTIQPDLRVYTTYDANYNVTSLITYDAATQTWGVSERFVYSPYGSVETFDASFNAVPDALNWQYMYQGGRFDSATGLYHFGARNYSASLGIWISQDPLQYINGANTYQFVDSSPVLEADPSGRRLTVAQAQSAIPLGWTVSATPNLVNRIAHSNGPATTTESGWIYRTYTKVDPEIRASTYHVRAQETIFVPAHNGAPAQCEVKFKTFTVIRTRQITETIVTNNADAINNTANALALAGGAASVAGGIVVLIPGGQVAGAIASAAGGVAVIGGQVLGWAASAEETAPSTTTSLGSVLQTTTLP
ncbi:MAG: RHS repeat-associated core domain-containing protein [Phycisphaerales bacterium]|nr:RHS repeat-associated core domain-containing protein [Phycisphaerales bacterium]